MATSKPQDATNQVLKRTLDVYLESWQTQSKTGESKWPFGMRLQSKGMSLPPEDRAYLAEHPEESLTIEEFSDVEIASDWSREAIRAYDRGETCHIGFDDALCLMRTALWQETV